MDQVNGKQETKKTPSEFVMGVMKDFVKEHNRKPGVILMSPDILKDVYKELKARRLLPPDAGPFSLALITKKPMQFAGIEVAIIGGEKRLALI